MQRSQLPGAHWRSVVLVVLLSLFAVFVFSQAKAATRIHHRHYHHARKIRHRHHVPWKRHRIAHRRRVATIPDVERLSWGVPSNLLQAASRYVGMSNPTGFRGPWCMAFIEMVLRRTNHYALRSLRAIDGLRLGPHVRNPMPGDLAVMRHHITIVARIERGSITGLGGNQSHEVRYSRYPLSRVVAFVRPQ